MEAVGCSSEMLLSCNADEIAQMPKLHSIPPRYCIDRNKLLDLSMRIIPNSRPAMKALVLNALGRGFDFEDVDIAAPMGREALVNVQASGLWRRRAARAPDVSPAARSSANTQRRHCADQTILRA